MNTIDRWSVDIYLDEVDGETHAEARLATRETDGLRGRGKARGK